ncbi:MAG TPA: acyl-CoA dehydrogenase family protein [Candidatus Binataceae bacterium]
MSESVNRFAECIERARKLGPLIAEHAAESERLSQLSTKVVDAFHEAGLFRALLPVPMAGFNLTIAQQCEVAEQIARFDGATGWNFAIGSGGPVIANFVAREAFENIFADPRALVAGSFSPMGNSAVACDGGFRFTGKATYASGSAQATWLTASGVEMHNGVPQIVDGIPKFRAGMFPIRSAKVLNTWSVSGLRGTGSNDVMFENVFVPESYTFEFPNPRSAWQIGPGARIPLMVQLGGTLAAVALGIARHAIDALKELAVSKIPLGTMASLRERPVAQLQLGEAEGTLRAGRSYLYGSIAEIWQRSEAHEPFDLEALASARLASVTTGKLAARTVDLVYDAAGISAMHTALPIERCWRDVHAVTQHVTMNTARYEVAGRILFGLPPGLFV